MLDKKILVIGAVAAAVLWSLKKEGDPAAASSDTRPPDSGLTPEFLAARDVERLEESRLFYEQDLASRGFTATLSGNTDDAIYGDYLAALEQHQAGLDTQDLENYRQQLQADLANRGINAQVAGQIDDAMYISYQGLIDQAHREKVAAEDAATLGELVTFYEQDAARRGCAGTITGTNEIEVYDSYIALVESCHQQQLADSVAAAAAEAAVAQAASEVQALENYRSHYEGELSKLGVTATLPGATKEAIHANFLSVREQARAELLADDPAPQLHESVAGQSGAENLSPEQIAVINTYYSTPTPVFEPITVVASEPVAEPVLAVEPTPEFRIFQAAEVAEPTTITGLVFVPPTEPEPATVIGSLSNFWSI